MSLFAIKDAKFRFVQCCMVAVFTFLLVLSNSRCSYAQSSTAFRCVGLKEFCSTSYLLTVETTSGSFEARLIPTIVPESTLDIEFTTTTGIPLAGIPAGYSKHLISQFDGCFFAVGFTEKRSSNAISSSRSSKEDQVSQVLASVLPKLAPGGVMANSSTFISDSIVLFPFAGITQPQTITVTDRNGQVKYQSTSRIEFYDALGDLITCNIAKTASQSAGKADLLSAVTEYSFNRPTLDLKIKLERLHD